MKFVILVCFLFIATTCAQVRYLNTWTLNQNETKSGANMVTNSANIGRGTCTLQFPGPVYWIYCTNCDIVPSKSNSAEGKYVLAAPSRWQRSARIFKFVVNFVKSPFRIRDIQYRCNSRDIGQASVYSFPTGIHTDSVRSRVTDITKDGGANITLTFPRPVRDFRVDGQSTASEIEPNTFFIVNNWKGLRETWFQFKYTPNATNWFQAADIDVAFN